MPKAVRKVVKPKVVKPKVVKPKVVKPKVVKPKVVKAAQRVVPKPRVVKPVIRQVVKPKVVHVVKNAFVVAKKVEPVLPPSILDDALTCKINVKYPTEIIHISNVSPMIVDSDAKVQYTHTTVISDALFSGCKSKNLHIFLENLTVEQIDLFKKVLESIKPTQTLKNVSILTYQKDAKNTHMGYLLPINDRFRKITNLQASAHKQNKLMSTRHTVGKDQVTIQLVPHIKDTSELVLSKSWWYALIVSIPVCATGRLTQATGTCWCNTIINNLILVPELREKIIKAIEHPIYDPLRNKKFKDIPSANDVKDALFILFNNLLVRTERAQPDDGNLMADIAARLKSITGSDDKSEKLYHTAKKEGIKALEDLGDGGTIDEANIIYKLILDFYIPGKTYMQVKCCETHEVATKTRQSEIFNKMYVEMCSDSRCPAGSDAKKEFNKQLDNADAALPGPEAFDEIRVNPDTEVIFITNEQNKPVKVVPLQLTVDGSNYKLVGSKISIKMDEEGGGHSIAGLRCNDISYIYDSNNYIAYSDWHKGDFSGWLTKVGDVYGGIPAKTKWGRDNPANVMLIYIKDTSGFSLFGGKAKQKTGKAKDVKKNVKAKKVVTI